MKDEEENDWQAWNRLYKEERDHKTKERTIKLWNVCKRLGVSFKELQQNSWRLTKEGKPTIDYYPPSGKAYLHSSKKWIKVYSINYLIKVYE